VVGVWLWAKAPDAASRRPAERTVILYIMVFSCLSTGATSKNLFCSNEFFVAGKPCSVNFCTIERALMATGSTKSAGTSGARATTFIEQLCGLRGRLAEGRAAPALAEP
jgi:hypothetical protein